MIPDDEYDIGLDGCKYNLHARVIWTKGATPLTVMALKEKLKPAWKDLIPWGVTSIGKGCYEFVFTSIEDARRVRSVNSWLWNPGILKLFPWSRDFSPTLQNNTSVQVWMRIHGLSQEYWRKKIIFAIASSVGTPICVDYVTSKPAIERTFGHYARVLVDLDVSCDLKYEVLVERKGFAFFVEFEYENLPEFCSFCRMIGHNASVCRKAIKKDVAHKGKALVNDKDKELGKQHHKEPIKKKQWTQREHVVMEIENDNTNRFVALADDALDENTEPLVDTNPRNIVDGSPVHVSMNNEDCRDDAFVLGPVLGQNLEIPQLENSTEYDSEDGSSQASEFVDATQRLDTEFQANERATPVRVQQDIQFLNDVWANLEDADEVLIRSQQQAFNDTTAAEADIDLQIHHEVRKNIENSGFKLVTRKSPKKKTPKTLTSKDSNSYLTRSKVTSRHSQ